MQWWYRFIRSIPPEKRKLFIISMTVGTGVLIATFVFSLMVTFS